MWDSPAGQNPKPKFSDGGVVGELLGNMKEFIFPPVFDFLKNMNSSRPPIVMYVMPFSVELNTTDLQDMWQGVLPKIGIEAEEHTGVNAKSITHTLPSPFYEQKTQLPDDIRWMVFRVKQKGYGYYSDVTKDWKDDSPQAVFAKLGEIDQRPYTDNWPYDFCSLVELAKVKTSFKIKK